MNDNEKYSEKYKTVDMKVIEKKNVLNKWKYSNDDSIVLFITYYSDYKYFQCCINDKVQNGTV